MSTAASLFVAERAAAGPSGTRRRFLAASMSSAALLLGCGAPPPAPPPVAPIAVPASTAPLPVASAPPDAGAPEPDCPSLRTDPDPAALAAYAHRLQEMRRRSADTEHAIVVANDERATAIGLAVLRDGGDAADAYVAAALAEDVLLPGVTSLAGFASLLYYDARKKQTTYVAGVHHAPRDPAGAYEGPTGPPGRTATTPGAVLGLAEGVRRFGRRRLAEDAAPAIALAKDGFEVSPTFSATVGAFRAVLARTAYGRDTYLPGGQPPAPGTTLRLPAYARTLEGLAREGSSYFTRGAWARAFVRTVDDAGGRVGPQDLRALAAEVHPPIVLHRGGRDLLLANGSSRGGAANLMIAWDLFDAAGGPALRPFTGAWLEAQLWTFTGAMVAGEWTDGRSLPEDAGDLAREAEAHARAAREVMAKALPPPGSSKADPPGHSSAIVVVDADGDVAVGMHTINSFPFGAGVFVDGIPLSSAVEHQRVPPGEPVVEAVSPVLVIEDGAPRLALAQFGFGEFPADFTVLSAVLDAGVDLADAATGPRIGWLSLPIGTSPKTLGYLPPIAVDPRFPRADLCRLVAEGWPLDPRAGAYTERVGYVDAVSITPHAGPSTLRGVPALMPDARALGY